MISSALTFSLAAYVALANIECLPYPNTNALLTAHHGTWLAAAGNAHDWPTITTEEQCKQSCLDDNRCVMFVWHGSACADCAAGGWVHKCVTWHESDLESTNRKHSTSWPRQTGTISGSCRNARYQFFINGCDDADLPGVWVPIMTAVECGIAASQRGETAGCRAGACTAGTTTIRPQGCYGGTNGVYAFNAGAGCAGGHCGAFGQLCKQIGNVAPAPEMYRIFATGCGTGYVPINTPAECGSAATEMGVANHCRAGYCNPIAPTTLRPKGCYGGNQNFDFNPGAGCHGGTCAGVGQMCKKEVYRFYISGCPPGWESLTNPEECGQAQVAIGAASTTCRPGRGNCATTVGANRPGGCYGSTNKYFNFNAHEGCAGGSCDVWGQVCQRAKCTVYKNRSAASGKAGSSAMWPKVTYEGACRDICEFDPLCVVYTYISATMFSGEWAGRCITWHAGDLQDAGRQATTSWPQQVGVNSASCTHTSSGLWRGGALDDTEASVHVFVPHHEQVSKKNGGSAPYNPPPSPYNPPPSPYNPPPSPYNPNPNPYPYNPNQLPPPTYPYGTNPYNTDSKDDDNDSWKGWVIAVTVINILAILCLGIAVTVYFCVYKK